MVGRERTRRAFSMHQQIPLLTIQHVCHNTESRTALHEHIQACQYYTHTHTHTHTEYRDRHQNATCFSDYSKIQFVGSWVRICVPQTWQCCVRHRRLHAYPSYQGWNQKPLQMPAGKTVNIVNLAFNNTTVTIICTCTISMYFEC